MLRKTSNLAGSRSAYRLPPRRTGATFANSTWVQEGVTWLGQSLADAEGEDEGRVAGHKALARPARRLNFKGLWRARLTDEAARRRVRLRLTRSSSAILIVGGTDQHPSRSVRATRSATASSLGRFPSRASCVRPYTSPRELVRRTPSTATRSDLRRRDAANWRLPSSFACARPRASPSRFFCGMLLSNLFSSSPPAPHKLSISFGLARDCDRVPLPPASSRRATSSLCRSRNLSPSSHRRSFSARGQSSGGVGRTRETRRPHAHGRLLLPALLLLYLNFSVANWTPGLLWLFYPTASLFLYYFFITESVRLQRRPGGVGAWQGRSSFSFAAIPPNPLMIAIPWDFASSIYAATAAPSAA